MAGRQQAQELLALAEYVYEGVGDSLSAEETVAVLRQLVAGLRQHHQNFVSFAEIPYTPPAPEPAETWIAYFTTEETGQLSFLVPGQYLGHCQAPHGVWVAYTAPSED